MDDPFGLGVMEPHERRVRRQTNGMALDDVDNIDDGDMDTKQAMDEATLLAQYETAKWAENVTKRELLERIKTVIDPGESVYIPVHFFTTASADRIYVVRGAAEFTTEPRANRYSTPLLALLLRPKSTSV